MTVHNSQNKLKAICGRIYNRFGTPNLHENYDEISQWFDTPLGQQILRVETHMLEEEVSNLFGYHFMQLSVAKNADFSHLSRINHSVHVLPNEVSTRYEDVKSSISSSSVISSFESLPFDSEQIDVTILHHALDFAQNPHQVLKEAARVTVARGYIVILGFNPNSLHGLTHSLSRFLSDQKVLQRHYLQTHRLRDWLAFLDFSCQKRQFGAFNIPINNERYLKHSKFIDSWIGGVGFPLGGSFCLIARKDKSGLTPIKPKWQAKSFIQTVPVPKQAIKVQNRRPALVLPFRAKHKQD